MKLTKFTKLVKKSGICTVIEIEDAGIWLTDGHAIYKASELPHMDDILQVYAILDIAPNKKKSPVVDIVDNGSDLNYGSISLADCPEPDAKEVEAEELMIQASYKHSIFNVLFSKGGELLFYNADYLAPIIDRVEEGYVRFFIRGKGKNKYIAVKDGFQLIAVIAPVKFLSDEYITELQDYHLACMDQLEKEKEQEKEKPADKDQQVMDLQLVGSDQIEKEAQEAMQDADDQQ